MKTKEIIVEMVTPEDIFKKIKKALPPKANITGFTIKAKVRGNWKYVGNSGSGPTTALKQLERMMRQMRSIPAAELFVTYWLLDATRKTGPINAMSYQRRVPGNFLKEDQERSPEYYKRKAQQYWRDSTKARQRGDNETGERLNDAGNKANKKYKQLAKKTAHT